MKVQIFSKVAAQLLTSSLNFERFIIAASKLSTRRLHFAHKYTRFSKPLLSFNYWTHKHIFKLQLEAGKIPNFMDSERMKTPKTDCLLKV